MRCYSRKAGWNRRPAPARKAADAERRKRLGKKPEPKESTPARIIFSTPRVADFFSQKSLSTEIGLDPEDWLLAVFKELLDNSLDACEEEAILPQITVTVTTEYIQVQDNGPGMSADTVARLLDMENRLSSRAKYVAPDRGAQGNFYKTLFGIAYVVSHGDGRVIITSRGVEHDIRVQTDDLERRPVITNTKRPVAKTADGGAIIRL